MLAGYPAPPSGPAIEPDDPDASFMLSRLDLYRQGREPLAGVANLCLTVLEDSARQVAVGEENKRKTAANHYRIARRILERVGTLSAKKGGPVARKAEGRSDPFTKEETRFLEAAVTVFIRRAAEEAADPKPKPMWDVHLANAGNRAGSLAGVPRPLIAGPSGSAVSPRLSGWPARPGICRPSPRPTPGQALHRRPAPQALVSQSPPAVFTRAGYLSPRPR